MENNLAYTDLLHLCNPYKKRLSEKLSSNNYGKIIKNDRENNTKTFNIAAEVEPYLTEYGLIPSVVGEPIYVSSLSDKFLSVPKTNNSITSSKIRWIQVPIDSKEKDIENYISKIEAKDEENFFSLLNIKENNKEKDIIDIKSFPSPFPSSSVFRWTRNDLASQENPFKKYNIPSFPYSYSKETYDKYLKDSDWSEEDTNQLIKTIQTYGLRWSLIFDRLNLSKKYTNEEIKKRFFKISSIVFAYDADPICNLKSDKISYNTVAMSGIVAYTKHFNYDFKSEQRRKSLQEEVFRKYVF